MRLLHFVRNDNSYSGKVFLSFTIKAPWSSARFRWREMHLFTQDLIDRRILSYRKIPQFLKAEGQK